MPVIKKVIISRTFACTTACVFHGLLECEIDCGDNGDEYVHRLFVCVRVL